MFEELKNNVEKEFLEIADCIEDYESKEKNSSTKIKKEIKTYE